ncbi:MAG: RHS repeat-associated core domain-containing protein [Planctomycetes bacterium]|nr:RHS repeat-associated core domain-containing protein [Planctomycetota bacterium]
MQLFSKDVHGYGWFVNEHSRLQQYGTSLILISGGNTLRHFVQQGAAYVSLRFDSETLATEAGGYVFTDTMGNQTHFYGFDTSSPPSIPILQQGSLKTFVTSAGATTSTVYNTDGTLAQISRSQTSGATTSTETFTYTYDADDQKITNVKQAMTIGAGSPAIVRQADYEYWKDTTADFGPNRSLQRVTIKDGQTIPAILSQCSYRYYKQGEANGITGLLKIVFNEKSYARIVGAGLDPLVATDAQVLPYADNYFEYDTSSRVTKEIAQGTTCSCSTGQGTYLFAYQTSANADGYNSWLYKTTETEPDGNIHIVYSNYAAETMLFITKEVTTGKQWLQFYQYDGMGRPILKAEPSAITGFDETKPDLLNSVSGNYQYLSDSAGLIHRTVYGTSTTATATTAGNVAGYILQESLSQGETGAAVPLHGMTYYSHADAGGAVIYPQATDTIYRNTDGTGGMTTAFSYTWQGSTNQILAKTTTAPVVPTAQNGSNVATATTVVYDLFDRPSWVKDQEGFLAYHAYDTASGGEAVTIRDVNTALTADFTGLPSGWTTPAGGGLHLKTVRTLDLLGRATQVTDPRGTNSFRVFQDSQHAVRTYPGWNGTATTGPTIVEREDWPNNYRETLTMSVAPAVTGGAPTGAEAIGSLQSLSRDLLDQSSRPIAHDDYVSFSGITYGTTPTLGTLNTNYYRSTTGYDKRGNPARFQDAAGSIRRVVNDLLDRSVSSWTGINDTVSGEWAPANAGAMVQTGSTTYDFGNVGDGNVTSSVTMSGSATYTTSYISDFRDRQTQITRPDGVIVLSILDNLGRPTSVCTYAGTVASSSLRAKQEQFFDERGQPYWRRASEVDPVTGAIGNLFLTKSWFTPRGLLAKTRDPGGLFTKRLYDGAGRVTTSATSYQDSESLYTDALTLASDTLIEQTNSFYDKASNVVATTRLLRKPTDTTSTGALTVSNAVPLSSVTWYDIANRPVASGDYGRDSGTTKYLYTTAGALIDANANGIPDEAEAAPRAVNSSNDYRITATGYDAAGRPFRTTDSLGRITQRIYDGAGLVTAVIENYVDGVATETETSTDRTTQTIYGPGWRVATLRALNPKGLGNGVEQQDTRYLYGSPFSATWPTNIIYPDSTDTTSSGTDQVKVGYDRLGRTTSRTDQRGVIHAYAFDTSGRLQADAATIPALTGDVQIDTGVQRIERAYDDVSRVKGISSFSATTGGTVVNAVAYTYNNLSQVARSDQSHSGAVVSGTTPGVSYTYADGASGGTAAYLRLTRVTYPTTATSPAYLYAAAGTIGDRLNRLESIASDPTGTTKYLQYTSWLGAGTTVVVDHPAVTGGLSFVQVGTSIDMVNNFMEPTDWKWRNTSGSVVFDRYLYGYDRVGNRVSRQNAGATARDEVAVFDGLNRLTKFNRGTLGGGTITDTAATFNQAWTLDSLGNWGGFAVDANGGANSFVTQARLHNRANEIDVDNIDSNAPGIAISGTGTSWIDPVYDPNGNMRSGPKPGSELTTRQHYRWDAWNRLTTVLADNAGNPGTTVATYVYDGLGRRIRKVVGVVTLDSFYNERWEELEVRKNGATAAYAQVIYDPRDIDEPAVRFRDADANGTLEEALYFAQDAKYNVSSVITSAGVVAERYAYDSYGKTSIYDAAWASRPSSNYDNQVLFTGRTLDVESGLYQYRYRFFDPSLGRFLSRDPLGYVDGKSLYNSYFVPNGRDPFGLEIILDQQTLGDRSDEAPEPPHEPHWWDFLVLPKPRHPAPPLNRYDFAIMVLSDGALRGLSMGGGGIRAGVGAGTSGGACPVIPKVANPKLGNLVSDLYKGARYPNGIGTGMTADAVRNELRTGLPTFGKFHSQKAAEYNNALQKWLNKNPTATYYDRLVAQSIMDDLQAALSGF